MPGEFNNDANCSRFNEFGCDIYSESSDMSYTGSDIHMLDGRKLVLPRDEKLRA